ncbi:F-box/kelch-repeat protein At1g74510-like isoform X2 [Oryza sativa Japonica Group]|uniref:F-box/kelch-repeat protein At1g74510-like isoform X2 n=1 Tax=Oryza sativa subsp. japonica TaxID=39947 RepID=UPI00339C2F4F
MHSNEIKHVRQQGEENTNHLLNGCSFGSFDEIAIVAGGCDKNGQVLKSAELYNSETGHWETLADMNLARRLSSSFFLDGFYRVMYRLPRVRIAFFSRWSIQM